MSDFGLLAEDRSLGCSLEMGSDSLDFEGKTRALACGPKIALLGL